MNGLDIIARAKANRIQRGLTVTWLIPDRAEPWTAYPSSEAVKQQWIANGERKGWTLVAA